MQEPLTTLPDGTIKQVSPFNGTQVWTVPGRANRPFINRDLPAEPIDHTQDGWHCSFCEHRYLDSPPERSRLVANDCGGYVEVPRLPASKLEQSVAAFRRVANLFPILPLHYWEANHGYQLSQAARVWRREYLADPLGRTHLLAVARRIAEASGITDDQWDAMPEDAKLAKGETFFGSCHDLIIGHRHYVDGAEQSDQLASSGTLTPAEHRAYIAFTIASAEDLFDDNPYARYVTIFQNWLRPAGASFDHLHKQLAAIDQLPPQLQTETRRLGKHPRMYRKFGVEYAERQGLVVARNDYAVAYAGFGHRYPSLEIHSLSSAGRPWELSPAELGGLSDLVHAMHVASGVQTPVNEEWHYQPPTSKRSSPVRVVLKWRINNLAGFEGATKIYLNTISPWTLKDRVLAQLEQNPQLLGDVSLG